MKKIINILLVSAIAFTFIACDYNERNFPGIEEKEQIKNVVSYNHEISTTDITTIANALRAKKTHEDSVAAGTLNNAKAFSPGVPSQPLVPYVLTATYRAADVGSIANVTFPFVNDIPEYVAKLSSAGSYVVSAADYESVWGTGNTTDFFTPSNTPAAKLPAVLKGAFSDAADGDIKVVRYRYSDYEPAGFVSGTRLSENFDSGDYIVNDVIEKRGWTHYKEDGTYSWQAKQYNGNFYAQMSNGSSATATNKAWMISPKIDLSQTTNNAFSFDVCVGYWKANCLEVKITTDAALNADPTTNSWTDVTAQFSIPTTPVSGYGTLGTAGSIPLNAYTGSIFIAFRYDGDGTTTPQKSTTYQIDNILVEGTPTTAGSGGPEPNPQPNHTIYTYNGTAWAPYANTAVVLNPVDYDAMGTPTISATIAPNYLPNFLSVKFPYAQEGTTKAVVYGSKTGNPGGNAAEYQYTAGAWTPTAVVVKKTEQYVVSSEGWMFDPTIVYTARRVSGGNPEILKFVTYIINNMPEKFYQRGTYVNEEHYYGFDAYYAEIHYDNNRTLYGDPAIAACTTNEEKYALFDARLEEAFPIFAQVNFPTLQTHVSGVEQFLKVRLMHYFSGSNQPYFEHTLKCIKSGTGESDPAEFEYVGKKEIPSL
jgi:hypothetical protein